MALRGDKITLRVQQHSSGVVNEIIASSTDVSIDFTGEALKTTGQEDGLHNSYIGGMVDCTITGNYLLAATGDQFTNLFAHMNAGDNFEVEVYRDTTKFLDGEGVLTSLQLSGGLADSLATGSYSIQCSGNMAV